MMSTLIEAIQNQFRVLTSHGASRRRRRVNSVSPEQLESRHLLSAVVGPVVDYATGPAGVSGVNYTVQLNDSIMVFTMSTLADGNELWRSDGTAEGTFRLTDIVPGPSDSYPSYLTVVNETAYFNIFGSGIVELWKTDGTVQGTQRITVPDQGDSQQTAFFLTKYNDTHLAFVSDNDVWITDGTTGGTTKIVELSDSSLNINGLQFDHSVPGDERVYLATSEFVDNSYKSHLVRYDSQSQLTTILVSSDQGSNAIELRTLYQGRLLFRLTDAEHGTELWYSDGTPETTTLWMDINAGPENSYPAEFTQYGESLYFFATSAEFGYEVWFLSGSSSLPQIIDIVPGTGSSFPNHFGIANGLYLNSAYGIYRLEGENATSVPQNAYPTFPTPVPIQGNADNLYFFDGRLAAYDGASVQTVSTFGKVGTFLGTIGNGILFVGDDLISGPSLWKSDGTASGTSLVVDPEPGTAGSYPTLLTNIHDNLGYFTSDIPYYIHNSDLLQVNSTNQVRVIDPGLSLSYGPEVAVAQNGALIYQKKVGSNAQIVKWDGSEISPLTNVTSNGVPVPPIMQTNGHQIVLLAHDTSPWAPYQLWAADSNGVLTEQLASFDSIHPDGITEVAGKIYFQAFDNSIGQYRTWRTDGTVDGTIPLSQLSPEFGRGNVFYSGDLVFSDTQNNRGIVFLNGSTDQVNVVSNGNNVIQQVQPFGRQGLDTLFVRNGNQIWRTHGTTESTQLVTTLPGSATNEQALSQGGSLYFILLSFAEVNVITELWKTDGTAEGTLHVATLADDTHVRSVNGLTEFNGKLFFALDNSTTGYSEVWTSDGTQSGTLPIATNLIIDEQVTFVGYDGGIGFRAATPEVGYELFRIDTTIPVVAPNNISVHHYGEGVDLTWPDVTGAIQYDIWMQNLSDPSAPVIKKRVNAPRLPLLDDMGYFIDNQIGSSAYRIWVRSVPVLGDPSAWSVAKDFTVGADPVLFSTPAITTDTHPNFKWVGPSDAVSYEIWLTNRDTKTRVFNSAGLTSTSFQVDQTLTPARYAVWVRGTRSDGTLTNWSAVNEFNVVRPAIEFTGGVGVQRTSRPTFTWPLVTGATGYNLQIVIAGTSTTVYEANDLKGLWHVPSMELAGGNYTIRVQAFKGTNPLSASGAGQSLRILIPPANLRSTETGFAWDAVPTAVSYTYELRNVVTQAVLYSKTQVGTTFTPPAPLSPGRYVLRVHANFFGGSSQRTSLPYEIFQPATVSITSSNAATVDGTPTITWGTITGAATYQVVVTRPGNSVSVYDRVGIVGTSHRIDRILIPGTYQIQVRAIWADGSRSGLSAIQQLVIGPAPVVSRANESLQWNSIKGATHYELWVNYLGTPVKPKIVYQPNVLQTSYPLASSLPKGRYQAWVRAVRAESGETYTGLWSVALNFDIL